MVKKIKILIFSIIKIIAGFTKRSENSPLKEYSKRKNKEYFKIAENTIDNLLKSNEKVSFKSVSEKSGLSRSYLYRNDEIRTFIQENRRH